MKLYLGLTESSPPQQTRVFADVDGKLVDLNLAYAAYLLQVKGEKANAYELSAFYFQKSIAAFLQRGEPALKALEEVLSFTRKSGVSDLYGPTVRRFFITQKKSGYCRRFKGRKKVSSSVSPTKLAWKRCPRPKSPRHFTNFPRLS